MYDGEQKAFLRKIGRASWASKFGSAGRTAGTAFLEASGFHGIDHFAGSGWTRAGTLANVGSFGSKALSVGMGSAFMGYGLYTGYQEGGISGAAINAAMQMAFTRVGAQTIAGSAIGSTMIGAAAGVGLLNIGAAWSQQNLKFSAMMRDRVSQWSKMRGRIDMGGGPSFDPYGNIATSRQRAMTAINNSHINGRNAIGMEAAILHRTY